MPNTPEAQGPSILRDKVQGFRDKARETLRMEKVAALLQDYFHAERVLKTVTKDAEEHAEMIEIMKYEATKLDDKHPAYKEKLERAETTIKNEEKRTEKYAESIEKCQKSLTDIDTQIAEVEQGKYLVSIDNVESLTRKLIERDMYTS